MSVELEKDPVLRAVVKLNDFYMTAKGQNAEICKRSLWQGVLTAPAIIDTITTPAMMADGCGLQELQCRPTCLFVLDNVW